ncbi:MAG: sulfatase [Sphingobacteriaceae bacterium]|jgi:arylsulfatase A-like enzyme|nr:sulfatase [Sphingobacteriaceae bacterium]
MKKAILSLLVFCPLLVLAQNASKPNIIFILADDLGYSELGCYGNKFNETPNLDRLASKGIRFTNFYAAAPVCSPYRTALMTGQYPARVGIIDYLRPKAADHLDTAHYTLAEMMRDNGYHTGIVGKWHLSGYKKNGAPNETLPDKHGFQEVLISENQGISVGPYWYPYQFNLDVPKKMNVEHEFLTDRQNLEALEFIDRNKTRPFFLYLSHYAVHTWSTGKPELVDHFRKKTGAGKSPVSGDNKGNDPYKNWPEDVRATTNNPHLAAQLFSIDEGVGLIQKKLKELGLDKNTIIIFTSDNGGETRITTNAPLRGGKSMLYEGGVREPMIVYNPQFSAKSRTETARLVNLDFYPTFMELTMAKPNSQKLDGFSFAKLLQSPKYKMPERTFYWHYPLAEPHFLGGRSAGSILKGDWKLIEYFDDNSTELFNLKIDPSETVNLYTKYPEKVTELSKDLKEWRIRVGASNTARD